MFASSSGFTATGLGAAGTAFKLEVIPPKGAVLFIERSTPIYWNTTNSLD